MKGEDDYLHTYDFNEQRRLEQEKRILKSERELRPEDIRFGDDVEEMNEHLLNFYMETWFNVDEVFGTNVCTDENEDYLNVYANYDMAHNRLCDTLSIVYWKGDDCEEYEYRLSEAEKEMILPKMDAYCKERTEMSLSDYCAKRIAEDQEIAHTQAEQPKKPAVKRRKEER